MPWTCQINNAQEKMRFQYWAAASVLFSQTNATTVHVFALLTALCLFIVYYYALLNAGNLSIVNVYALSNAVSLSTVNVHVSRKSNLCVFMHLFLLMIFSLIPLC